MGKNYFDGMYYKHTKNTNSLIFIAGISDEQAFVQVGFNNKAYYFHFPKESYFKKGETISIENNMFSPEGIRVLLKNEQAVITGSIAYGWLDMPQGDVMGFFKYLPMECRHVVTSMSHGIMGKIRINGEEIDFTGGKGYIEGDRGRSFPESYMWLQCNSFEKNMAVTAMAARLNLGIRLNGCLAIIKHEDKEYRIATYNGGRELVRKPEKLVLAQNPYIFEADLKAARGIALSAPKDGRMTRNITESNNSTGIFKLYKNNRLVFSERGSMVSVEYVEK